MSKINLYIMLIMLLFLNHSLFSQWHQQQSNTTSNLYAVSFPNPGLGIVVGEAGIILKTSDGGENWNPIISGTSQHLYKVSFSHSLNGIAVGNSGTILKTTNAGDSWSLKNSGTTNRLNSVFYHGNDAIAVGNNGTVSFTTDGGDTWNTQVQGLFTLNDVFPLHQDTIFIAASNGMIIKVLDGGNINLLNSGTTNNLYGIQFTDSYNGMAIGANGTILRTTNGGDVWVSVLSGTNQHLYDMDFYNTNFGIVVGDGGTILKTFNNGISWTADSSLMNSRISGACLSNYAAAAVCDDGKILKNNSFTPVEIVSFSAFQVGNEIQLTWETATELNNCCFEIERQSGNEWVKIGLVPGSGTATELRSYNFIDNLTDGIKFRYRLKQIDLDGTYNYSKEIEIIYQNIINFELEQNYPNPFNPYTVINYALPYASLVKVEVFNMLGESAGIIVNGIQEPGYYEADWNAGNLASGIYFYRMEAKATGASAGNNFLSTKKMILLR